MENVPQVVQGEYNKYGNLWKRVIASIGDAFVVGPVGVLLLFLVIRSLGLDMEKIREEEHVGILILLTAMMYLIPLIYSTLLVGKYGWTLGCKALRLKIVKVDGNDVGYIVAFLRAFVSLVLYSLPYHVGIILAVISAVMILFDKKKQAIHDKICKTVVLYKS